MEAHWLLICMGWKCISFCGITVRCTIILHFQSKFFAILIIGPWRCFYSCIFIKITLFFNLEPHKFWILSLKKISSVREELDIVSEHLKTHIQGFKTSWRQILNASKTILTAVARFSAADPILLLRNSLVLRSVEVAANSKTPSRDRKDLKNWPREKLDLTVKGRVII